MMAEGDAIRLHNAATAPRVRGQAESGRPSLKRLRK
jgi:hypothetical protein